MAYKALNIKTTLTLIRQKLEIQGQLFKSRLARV